VVRLGPNLRLQFILGSRPGEAVVERDSVLPAQFSPNRDKRTPLPIVFLLDQNQPASIQQSDFGHAVAIHSGSHPFPQNRNCVFLFGDLFECQGTTSFHLSALMASFQRTAAYSER
jgi:hypothetical protein